MGNSNRYGSSNSIPFTAGTFGVYPPGPSFPNTDQVVVQGNFYVTATTPTFSGGNYQLQTGDVWLTNNAVFIVGSGKTLEIYGDNGLWFTGQQILDGEGQYYANNQLMIDSSGQYYSNGAIIIDSTQSATFEQLTINTVSPFLAIDSSGIHYINHLAFYNAGTRPTLAAGFQNPSGSVGYLAGTDGCFSVNLFTAAGQTPGVMIQVTFSTPFASAPVILFACGGPGGGSGRSIVQQGYIGSVNANGFAFSTSASAPGSNIIINFWCVG